MRRVSLLLLLLVLAGCGSATGTPTVATARSGPPAGHPSTDPVTAYVDAQRRFVGCLRAQGYDLPDPDAKGFVDFGEFLSRTKLRRGDAGFLAAQTACQKYQIPVPAQLSGIPPLTPRQIEDRRAYARCMRANGMPDWPDPGPDGEWLWNSDNATLDAQQQAANDRALQVCDPVLDGRPPASPDPHHTAKG